MNIVELLTPYKTNFGSNWSTRSAMMIARAKSDPKSTVTLDGGAPETKAPEIKDDAEEDEEEDNKVDPDKESADDSSDEKNDDDQAVEDPTTSPTEEVFQEMPIGDALPSGVLAICLATPTGHTTAKNRMFANSMEEHIRAAFVTLTFAVQHSKLTDLEHDKPIETANYKTGRTRARQVESKLTNK